jgi:hypothetical protein
MIGVSEGATLAALDRAMDELAQQTPMFHAECVLPALSHIPRPVLPTRILAQRGEALKLSLGAFIAPRAGHYLFMATTSAGVRVLLRKNGLTSAEPLDRAPTLLVAALQLVAGDGVALVALAATETGVPAGAVVRWRGVAV